MSISRISSRNRSSLAKTSSLVQRVIRPAIDAIGLQWYGWHGFRRRVASNLYALGADDKVVQRILATPNLT
jgi:hypothetical protein